jgi:exoribonuclease R
MTYHHAQRAIKQGVASESLALLREIGRLRKEQERRRGGVSISPPSQEVTRVGNDFELAYDVTLPVEKWNAQVSLLAGMCAAATMIDGGVGIVRTLPSPTDGVVQRLRHAAKALGIIWPDDQSYADAVRDLSSEDPIHAAFLTQALDALRGAGYAVIDSATGPPPTHGAIAAPYAHVTAPLRRLADRFANEIVVALCADEQPPAWATESLPELPDIMQDADRRQKAAARAVVDLAECLVLRTHVGQTFTGAVIDVEGDHATVLLKDPPVIAALEVDGLVLGTPIELRLAAVDLDARRLEFSLP